MSAVGDALKALPGVLDLIEGAAKLIGKLRGRKPVAPIPEPPTMAELEEQARRNASREFVHRKERMPLP